MYPSPRPPPSNHNHTTTFHTHTHMCIALPSLLPTGVMSALSRHSPAKRKYPNNQEWRTVGASRRPQIVGNQCDETLVGFQPLFSGSHKRLTGDYFERAWSARGPDIGPALFFSRPIVQVTSAELERITHFERAWSACQSDIGSKSFFARPIMQMTSAELERNE